MTKLVYVAGPYTNPDPIKNTHEAIGWAEKIYELSDHRLVPVIPHLTLLWHMVSPHDDITYWYKYDLKIMSRCDIIFRFPGASTGADGEVAVAKQNGQPVVYKLAELLAFA